MYKSLTGRKALKGKLNADNQQCTHASGELVLF